MTYGSSKAAISIRTAGVYSHRIRTSVSILRFGLLIVTLFFVSYVFDHLGRLD